MLRSIEMSTDEQLNRLPSLIRKQKNGQTDDTHQDYKRFKAKTAGAAHAACHLREEPNDKEVATDEQDRQRCLQHRPRWVEVEIIKTTPEVAPSDKNASEDERATLDSD